MSQDPSYFTGERPEVAFHVPAEARRVLEVGCGAGMLGRSLKAQGVEQVWGMELDPKAAETASQWLDGVLVGDVETMPFPPEWRGFDCLICADVLEHLHDPLATLRRLGTRLAPGATVIASLPNVRFFGLINLLVEGHWTYADSGILDRTHLRFFTIREMVVLFEQAGIRLTGVRENLRQGYENHLPAQYPADFSHGRYTLHGLNEFEFRDLFVFQYVLVGIRD